MANHMAFINLLKCS